MAIRLIDRYPNRANPADADYPHGSGRNKSDPTADDGTPFDQDRFNDQEAFFQGLLERAGITPSGTVDTVTASDYIDALRGSLIADSLTDLQSFPTQYAVDGFIMQTAGRTSAGDGGEGHFRWDSSDLSTEVGNDEVTASEGDGGIYVAPDSDKTGASGAWVRQFKGPVSLLWYGTDVSSWNIATRSENQGEVVIPGGGGNRTVYDLDDTLTLNACSLKIERGVTLRPASGFSGSALIETVNFSGRRGFVNGGNLEDNGVSVVGIRAVDFNWKFEDIFISGFTDGISIENHSQWVVGCFIENCSARGVRARDVGGSKANGVILQRNTINTCDVGIDVVDALGFIIRDNIVQKNATNEILISAATEVRSCLIEGNYIESDADIIAVQIGDKTGGGSNVAPASFRNNWVVNNGTTSASVAVQADNDGPISIEDNWFAGWDTVFEIEHSLGGSFQRNNVSVLNGTIIGGAGSLSRIYFAANNGFEARKEGSDTMASGTSLVTVNHGLDAEPNWVDIEWTSNVGEHHYIANINATSFELRTRGNVTADRNFRWQARVGGQD